MNVFKGESCCLECINKSRAVPTGQKPLSFCVVCQLFSSKYTVWLNHTVYYTSHKFKVPSFNICKSGYLYLQQFHAELIALETYSVSKIRYFFPKGLLPKQIPHLCL